MNSAPNLFTYATSELSQDAFICWLAAWAAPEFKDVDRDLHQCAVALLNEYAKQHGLPSFTSIDSVEIDRQWEHVDVLIKVNHSHIFIVEDKTYTGEHSDQLRRYMDAARKEWGKSQEVRGIYYKTEDECRSELIEKKDKGFEPIGRSGLLEILKIGKKSQNAILNDYRKHLSEIEQETNSFQKEHPSEWSERQCQGFYRTLDGLLGDPKAGWGYASNPQGGVWVLYWHGKSPKGAKDVELYLQLEKTIEHSGKDSNRGPPILRFRISVSDRSTRSELRNLWHERVMAAGSQFGLELEKPARFGVGDTMTVCQAADGCVLDKNGHVLLDATVGKLRQAEMLIDFVAKDSSLVTQ